MFTTARALLLGAALTAGTLGAALPGPAPALSVSALLAPAAHAEIPATKLGELEAYYDAAISPDGNKVAVILNIDGEHGLAVMDISQPSNPPKLVSLGETIKPAWVKWANNDRVLMSVWQSRSMRGTPLRVGSLYSFDVVAGEGDFLVEPPRTRTTGSSLGRTANNVFEQFYNNVVDFLDDDPDHILMSFMDGRQNVRPVLKVDVATGRYSTVERGSVNIQDWITDNSGAVRVAKGLRDDAKTMDDTYMRIRTSDGEWRPQEFWTGIDANTPIYGFTADPDVMVVGLRRGRDTMGLYTYDLRTRTVGRELFHNDDYDVGSIVVDADSGEVIGARYVGEESTTELFDGYDTTVESIRRANPDFQLNLVDTADNGDTLLYTLSNPYTPGALFLQKGANGAPYKVADVRPGVSPDEFGMVVPVKYTARDGQRIPAFVTLPPTVNSTAGIKSLPFVVLPHGGPFARDAARFDYFAQFFASRGYGVLQMNFRGSTGYGESFAEAGRENWKVMRDDVTDGTRWLVEKGYADPDRICAAGWSYGGYAALMGGLEHPELYSCVISIAGLSDIPDALSAMEDYRFGRASKSYLEAGFRDNADMRDNSPARLAKTMTLPTFVAHGTLDQQVRFGQHRKLVRALRKSPAKLTELSFEDEDHFMSNQKNRQKMLAALDKFLVSTNGPSEFVKK